MAVLWVRPAGDTRYSISGDQGERVISATFNIKSSVVNETQITILNCGLLPVFGYSPFPTDLYAICSKVDLKQNREGSQFWTAECEWRTVLDRNPQDQQKNPDQRRPRWSYSFQPIAKYFPSDLDGNAFVDTAGTPFDPPPERPIWVNEVRIERYEATLNRKSDRRYLNATNSDSWQSAAAGEAFIHNIEAVEVYEFGQYWFRRTFTVLVSPRITVAGTIAGPNAGGSPFVGAWDYECALNQGTRYLPAAGPNAGKPQPIVNGGFIDGRAQRLDANGAVLATTAQNVYLKFRLKNKIAFAGLNLVPPY